MTPLDTAGPAPKLYDYAPSANCYKVRLLFAQLEQDYERVPIDIFAGDTLTDEYGQKNPARTTPVLEVTTGVFLPESNAILLATAEGTPYLPDHPLQRWQVYRWLFFEQAEIVPALGGLRFGLLTNRIAPAGKEAGRRRIRGEAALRIIEHEVHSAPFLAGEHYTVADIAVYGYVHVASEAAIELGRYPAVEGWLQRVESQDRFMNDLVPYPANAVIDAGSSIYD